MAVVGERELSARERRMVHMTSDIFGGVDKSVYSTKAQKEMLANLKETFKYVKQVHVPESMNLPSAGEQKKKLMAGNQAVLPGSTTNGPSAAKRDPEFMPKEFWYTSVDLQWHDVRNERCRHKNQMAERVNLGAKEKYLREMSSELFEKDRLTKASADRSDLIAETDYLTIDSSLHERHASTKAPENQKAFASDRVQANLAASGKNTMPQADVEVKAPPPLGDSVRTSGPDMRNFSELFGTEMGRRAQPITERQDLLGTTKCSFLDFRNEIESARKDPGRISQADSPRNRKEAEMSSTLAALPVAAKVPELQQAMDAERGFWDSKDGFGIGAEVSRRRREKDFRKDFKGDVHHLQRKQECLGSTQVKENIGLDSTCDASSRREALESARSQQRLKAPHSPIKHSGVSAAQREDLLRRAKDTKLASLQSSIFT
mmetsp:Transcript_47057/g.102473  ORF Transcript_47057/g.102473 Transcript_47057/m.102473 type:complete len:432 (-) Transcript_47057:101-1396(-)